VPVQPAALRQGWNSSTRYGNSAPATKDIWRKFKSAEFRCTACRSQRRITLDHVDGNAKNHSLDNLAVLCFDCNRAKSRKSTGDLEHSLRIARTIIAFHDKEDRFPTNAEILTHSGVKQIGGATYLVAYLRARLTDQAQDEEIEQAPVAEDLDD
jgi:hypothetical protein